MRFPQIRDYTAIVNILAMALIVLGCSNMERSENDEIRRRNCKGEFITRNHDEKFCAIEPPLSAPRSTYPWDGDLPKITKDFFRCKGTSANPPIINKNDPNPIPITDCEGSARHGLPIIRGQQGVYPVLIDLLNYVQKTTGKRVVITSGHRCPEHNKYVDPSKENSVSKYQIGAAVDFYVQEMEKRPMEVVQVLMDYYLKTARYKGVKEFSEFQRYDKPDVKVATKPWFNKEIFIKVSTAVENRNGDNRHSYPYITVQVRTDRETSEKVVYDWKKANSGYPHG